VLVPMACLLALASCLVAGQRRGRAYLAGASARTVLPLDVATLLLGAGAAAASILTMAPDDESGVALIVALVGALPLLPLALRGRGRAVARAAVAVTLNGWAVLTGLSVGALFVPAAFFSAGAVVFAVWTVDPGAVRR